MKWLKLFAWSLLILPLSAAGLQASELNLAIPDLHKGEFHIFGGTITAWNLLFYGAMVIAGTLGISLYLRAQIKKLPAHRSMLSVAEVIFQTCKTYLIQQGKFLLMLFAIIAVITAGIFPRTTTRQRPLHCASGHCVQTLPFAPFRERRSTKHLAPWRTRALHVPPIPGSRR